MNATVNSPTAMRSGTRLSTWTSIRAIWVIAPKTRMAAHLIGAVMSVA